MIHHIRFLKLPRVEVIGSSSLAIKALITITTDLGDSFLPAWVAISAGLWSDGRLVGEVARLNWQNGMRSLRVHFQLTDIEQLRWPLQMHISHAPAGRALNLLSLEQLPPIIDVCSYAIHSPAPDDGCKRVIRRFHLASGPILRIHEDSGDSIARHIWDAGVALIACMCSLSGQRLQTQCPSFCKLLLPTPSRTLNVLELGSGCGIVGKALALTRPNCHVILTDLPDAMDLIQDNIADSQLASGSRLSSMILDWDQDLPAAVMSQQLDLILVCDCTYNTDSIPALVRTLAALIARSPAATIVVANKIRHDSELSFFHQVRDVGLAEVEEMTIPVGGAPETQCLPENIYIHVYLGVMGCRQDDPERRDNLSVQ